MEMAMALAAYVDRGHCAPLFETERGIVLSNGESGKNSKGQCPAGDRRLEGGFPEVGKVRCMDCAPRSYPVLGK